MRKWIVDFTRQTAGNMAMMTALVAVPMSGIAGLAIDYLRYVDVQTELQAALDAAVLAGAVASSDNENAALTVFKHDSGGSYSTVTSVAFQKSGTVKVTGTVTATVPSTMASLIGITSMKLAITTAAESVPAADKLCIMTLEPSTAQEFLANSGADVNASSCTIQVKSTANPAAIFNAGTNIKSKKTCIEGNSIIDNGGTHPNLQTGCKTAADPYAGKIPAPSSSTCNFSNLNYSGNVTLSPGVYCGWMNFNSGTNVTLNPGTYVIKSGGWNVNGGTWTGNGVTFFYADTSKIQFNSAVAATLSAPTSGTYKDILMTEASGLSNTQFIFDDSKGFDMTGIIYLPSRDVVFNSNTTTRAHKMTAVMRSLILNSTNWNLTPYDNGSGSSGGMARLLN